MPICGGDVEGGEAAVGGGFPDDSGVYSEDGLHKVELAELDGGEEIWLDARLAAAQALAHLLRRAPSGSQLRRLAGVTALGKEWRP